MRRTTAVLTMGINPGEATINHTVPAMSARVICKDRRNHHDLMIKATELRMRTKEQTVEAGVRSCLVLCDEHRARSSSSIRQVRLWRLVSQLRVQLWARL